MVKLHLMARDRRIEWRTEGKKKQDERMMVRA
jgi:hypothetical protein